MKHRYSKLIVSLIVTITTLISFCSISSATINAINKEYSEEFQKWLDLPEEERNKVMMPDNMLEIEENYSLENFLNIDNVFSVTQFLSASYSTSYDLRDVIPENIKIKNQGNTELCWAFSALANLETNLAMQDKLNGKRATEYDYSVKHLAYATSREAFLNNAINEKGYNKNAVSSGNYWMATAYLTNGSGAVKDDKMPFEGDISNNININELNKEVTTTVIDAKFFNNPTTEAEKKTLMEEMKQYIMTNGGISAKIYGAQIYDPECYNNATGALYADDVEKYPSNHGVVIVGWNDNYSISNFNEDKRPSKPGAWIIKNSWGSELTYRINDFKKELYNKYIEYFNNIDITSAEQIPTDFVIEFLEKMYSKNKVIVSGDNVIIKVGDNGFMYVSYEDVNILTGLYTIENSKNYKDYDNIYQYDYLGANSAIKFSNPQTSDNKLYIANVFTRTNTKDEEITQIGITSLVPMNNCKVLINPNGSDKKFSDLQYVDLKEGDYENIGAGYHTIEFANPIKLTGNSFVVAIEMKIDNGEVYVPVLRKLDPYWKNVNTKRGISFIGEKTNIDNGNWDIDLGEDEDVTGILPIKAFTNNVEESVQILSSIEIRKEPTKTSYIEGENFDKSGMVVYAKYTNGTEKQVTDYTVTNAKNLKLTQESVTISYKENDITKTTIQNITVNKAQGEIKPDEPIDNEHPTPSDFEETKASITKAESYLVTSNSQAGYTIINIDLSSIALGDENSSRKFYYYLSDEKGEENIIKDSEWTEFSLINNSSAHISIDSRSLKNINDITDTDNLYLYVKEVATLNGESTETINIIQVTNDAELDVYVDGVKVDLNNVNKNQGNQPNQTNSREDETVAKGSIPQAGKTAIGTSIILAIMLIGGISYNRYKNIKLK